MNRFDAMDVDLDVMYDDVRVDEENFRVCRGRRGERDIFEILEILEGLVYMTVDLYGRISSRV